MTIPHESYVTKLEFKLVMPGSAVRTATDYAMELSYKLQCEHDNSIFLLSLKKKTTTTKKKTYVVVLIRSDSVRHF